MPTTKPHDHRSDDQQDKVVEDTFPASDPPASSGITGAENPAVQNEADAEPTGTPTSDRHQTETAHHKQAEETVTPDP